MTYNPIIGMYCIFIEFVFPAFLPSFDVCEYVHANKDTYGLLFWFKIFEIFGNGLFRVRSKQNYLIPIYLHFISIIMIFKFTKLIYGKYLIRQSLDIGTYLNVIGTQ